MVTGKANAFSLNTLQDRADMFVTHNDEVYEGQIVGENSRDNDLAVNPGPAAAMRTSFSSPRAR
jgi:GTP-binding protein